MPNSNKNNFASQDSSGALGKKTTVTINDLSVINNPYRDSDGRFYVYTNGSKQKHGLGADIYISQSEAKMCFKLPDECSMLLIGIKQDSSSCQPGRILGSYRLGIQHHN